MKLYQHYLGDLYVVTNDEVNHQFPETNQFLVLHTRLLDGVTFVLPFDDFHSSYAVHRGKDGPRFRFIADPADIMPEGGHP